MMLYHLYNTTPITRLKLLPNFCQSIFIKASQKRASNYTKPVLNSSRLYFCRHGKRQCDPHDDSWGGIIISFLSLQRPSSSITIEWFD